MPAQGLANGRERSRQRPRQAQDRVAQRRQRLRGAAGAHAAGVLAQAHVPAIEMGHNLAARGDAARLEAPVPLLDGAGLLKVRRRAVPEGITGGLLAQSLDQLRGERRRRMRGRCRP